MNSHFLNGLYEIAISTRLAIYGTGAYGIALHDYIVKKRPDIKIVSFLDSFTDGELLGKKVRRADKLAAMVEDLDLVLVGSDAYRNEIHEQLESLNYPKYYDIWFYPSMLYELEADILSGANDHFLEETATDKTLYAIYDLRHSPYTYDMLSFLFLAEYRRLYLRYKSLHIIILKDAINDRWRWNIHNILIPLTQLFSSISGTTVTSVDELAANTALDVMPLFPMNYHIDAPVTAYTLSTLTKTIRKVGSKPDITASVNAKALVRNWFAQRKIAMKSAVTLTLRQSPGASNRNSTLSEWFKFADYVAHKGFTPILLKDTYTMFDHDREQFASYITMNEASISLDLRMALYESSFVNIGISNGPMSLCIFSNHVPYLVHMRINENYFATSPRYLEEMGFPIGSQFPLAKTNQVVRWSRDNSYPRLQAEFDDFLDKNPI